MTQQVESEKILEDLRAKGERITKLRKALLSLLSHKHTVLSAPEILKALAKKSLTLNKTTIYREIDFLLSHKIIREVDLLDGLKRYELLDSGHHHHIVCTSCKKIECVEMHDDLCALEKKISSKYKFKIESHVLEFFGLCGNCA